MAKYFTFYDFTRSDTAKKKGIDNTPGEIETDNIIRLMDVLDDLREDWTLKCEDETWGKPGLNISSGYRCKELNKAVGGSKASAHQTGNAADIIPTNGRTKELIDFTHDWLKSHNIKWDQLIDEFDYSWMHLGLFNNSGEQRCQYFEID